MHAAEADVLAVLESSTCDQDGEIVIGMRVCISHAGSVNDGGLVEQILRFPQVVEQTGQFAELRTLDQPELLQFLGLIAVVSQRMGAGIDTGDVRLSDVLMYID